MRKTLSILSILFAVAFLFGETTAPAKKKKTAPKKSAAKKSTTARKPAVQAWRSTQRVPTPERYKEIQQALASKGYLEGKGPSGVWDDSSVSALKKFQQDQNLEPSGKLDSLSLIALGLGPRHDQPSPPSSEPRPAEPRP